MKFFSRSLAVFLILILCVGFRTYGSKQNWKITKADPKLFLKFCETKSFNTNDLPSGDSLAGTTLTFNAIVDSIMSDFNNIESAYLVLADASRDSDYATATNAAERTIDICFKDYPDLSGGKATLKGDASNWTGCDISLKPKLNESAKDFVRTLTHELGHCLGLDHPQETTHAIMSYFSSYDTVRLQTDDKIGLTFFYPEDESKGKEDATFGAGCEVRK